MLQFCTSEITSARHELGHLEDYASADLVFIRSEHLRSAADQATWLALHAAVCAEVAVLQTQLQIAVDAERAQLAAVTAASPDPEAAARADAALKELKDPSLLQLRPTSGLFHLMKLGFLDAFFKPNWPSFLAYFARILKRTKLSRKVQNYDASEQHYYFVSRGATLSLLRLYLV